MKIKSRKETRESVASILVTQGKYKFHLVSMKSEILKDTCFTITREDDPEQGFQRRLDEKRAQEIAKYVDSGLGSIPTAIVLSAQPEAELERNISNKTLSFKKHKKAFLILDGQHRVWGFIKAQKSTRVPVVIYEGLSRVQEAQLFIDINMNQKEVPKELLLDVKRLLEVENKEEKLCNEIFDNFYKRKDSILKAHINIGETQKGNLSRVIFNRAISNLINNQLDELSSDKKFEIVNNYLRAMEYVFKEIDNGLEGYIAKPIIFQGLIAIAPILIDKVLDKQKNLSYESFYNTLITIKDNLKVSDIKKYGKSYKQFGDKILNASTKRRNIPLDIVT